MPTPSPQDLARIDALRKEYRIEFAGELQPRQWPECHRPLLERVAAVGKREFGSYDADPCVIEDAPWKAEVKEPRLQAGGAGEA